MPHDKTKPINDVRFAPVDTPDGPRVRVTVNGEITIEATRLRIQAGEWAVVTVEAKDGKTYTFFLRKDVQFHDGAELTAEDVKATFDRIAKPPSGISSTKA